MIDEKELIYLLQIASDKAEEYLEPEITNMVQEVTDKIIEVINNIPKIEFPAYGSENYNSEDTQIVRSDYL